MSRVCPLLLALACSLSAACVPTRHVSVDEVKNLTKLDQVMEAQATYADPQFKKRDQAAFSDQEFATFADVAQRLQATALKTKDFSKGPAFDELAVRVHDRAVDLSTAAVAKDAAGARKALTDMKATCKECHSKFR
jgi:cytochrome c556